MIPEIGHVALILVLGMAIIQAVFPVVCTHRGIHSWITRALLLAVGPSLNCKAMVQGLGSG